MSAFSSSTQSVVSERIAMLRYIMIVGIVILHTPPYVPIAEIGPGLFDQVKAFFQNAAFRASVPVLTVISGYLLFRAGIDRDWRKLANKKARTLLIPFLVFNLGLLAAAYAAQRWLGISSSYQLIPFDAMTWLNAAFGLTGLPINYPLNFLRDLLALMLLSPLMGALLRKAPWSGLLAVCLIFLNNFDDAFVLRDVMPIMFYVGGMAALQKWDLLALDRGAAWCLGTFICVCVAVIYFRVANTNYLRIAAPFLIWPAASLLNGTRVGQWLASQSKFSFFIFVAHAPLLLVISMMYERIGQAIPYSIYWICTPVIVVVILSTIYSWALRHFPIFTSLALGVTILRPQRHSAAKPSIPIAGNDLQ